MEALLIIPKYLGDGNQISNRLLDGGRGDAMGFVVFFLNRTSSLGFVNGTPHGVGNGIRIHDNMPLGISSSTTNGLNQRGFGTKEAFLIRIQNGHQRNLRNIQSLSKQVNAHQNIKLIQTHISDNGGSFQSINIGMEILNSYLCFLQILGEVLCHFFGKGCYQNLIALVGFLMDFGKQVVNLSLGGAHHDFRIQKSCRTDNLLCP